MGQADTADPFPLTEMPDSDGPDDSWVGGPPAALAPSERKATHGSY